MSDCIKKGIIAKERLPIAAQLFLIFPQTNLRACILLFFSQAETTDNPISPPAIKTEQ
ncbi:MAG: hypothetical protein QNJ36_07860 [Calothrix sp. MO_167.B42]|nr:hypothetical protein [Calothrix sp. MO_167.B42]